MYKLDNLLKLIIGLLVFPLLVLMSSISPVQAVVTVTYYHTDALGSVVAASDESGSLLWTESYRPYGERQENFVSTDEHALFFTGKPHDDDTGLSYFGARYYNPSIGRFMGVDPAGFQDSNIHSFNKYAYANNNPYKYVDPDGELPILLLAFVAYDFYSSYQESGNIGDAAKAAALGLINPFKKLKTTANIVKKFKRTRGCCCFEKGTPVLTENGLKAIEEINTGDLVYSRDPETNSSQLKPVTELFLTEGKSLYEIVLKNKAGKIETLKVTDNHPYWVKGKGWVDSAKLVAGMQIESFENGELEVVSLTALEQVEDTYNFTVADFNTFFAGESKALVHNCKCVTANGQRTAKDGTRLGPSGKPVFHNSNSATRKKAIDGANAQGSGRVVKDKATKKQAQHYHGVKQNGERVSGPRKTHFNKRGDKPKR